MNNPEIWTIKMADHPQDDFVRLSAYKALDLQMAELMVENARLKAEVERLRKAGDGLYKSMLEIGCNEMADNFQYDDWWGSMRAWQSAKEGKQP